MNNQYKSTISIPWQNELHLSSNFQNSTFQYPDHEKILRNNFLTLLFCFDFDTQLLKKINNSGCLVPRTVNFCVNKLKIWHFGRESGISKEKPIREPSIQDFKNEPSSPSSTQLGRNFFSKFVIRLLHNSNVCFYSFDRSCMLQHKSFNRSQVFIFTYLSKWLET